MGGVIVQFVGLGVASVWSAALAYGGWVLAREGRSLLGIAAVLLALTPAGVFVYGRRSQSEERLRKQLELERAARPHRQEDLPFP